MKAPASTEGPMARQVSATTRATFKQLVDLLISYETTISLIWHLLFLLEVALSRASVGT